MASEETRSHWWWRPGWRSGRHAHTFHVTFDEERGVEGIGELRRVVAAYQRVLRDVSTMDPIPPRWLHLTMQRVGFADEVPQEDVARILAAARHRCAALAPIRLTVDRALVTNEGVLLPVEPEARMRELREAIRSGIGDVWGADHAPESSEFQPHVSVAYSNGVAPIAALTGIVDAVAIPPATVTVHAASLITLNRDDRVYTWTKVGEVPLDGFG